MPTDATLDPDLSAPAPPVRAGREVIYRHTLVVRITHWVNVLVISLLLMSGLQIFNAYPRLHWGRYGADADHAWLEMTALNPNADRPTGVVKVGGHTIVTTGVLGVSAGGNGPYTQRGFPKWATLPGDQDLATGRRWHFFLAWIFVLNGLAYFLFSAFNGHFRRDLAPTGEQLRPRSILRDIVDHIRLKHPVGQEAKRYNVLQKLTYLAVVFIILPLMVLTGLTMSPGVDAAAPWLLNLFGGRPSARSIHFITANLIVLFVIVHVVEVLLAGVFNELRSMITGRYAIRIGRRP
ncbi:MAG: cytochrome b/b6 domain-containing protein [Pseudomonadota bacterium]|nr:cytochrome b/b6 domain-containing protein [Pseudomonadota bacterium]